MNIFVSAGDYIEAWVGIAVTCVMFLMGVWVIGLSVFERDGSLVKWGLGLIALSIIVAAISGWVLGLAHA